MKWCIVGNHNGKQAVYWPGLVLGFVVVSLFSGAGCLLVYYALSGKVIPWPGLLGSIVGANVAVAITIFRYVRRTPVEQLPSI